MVVRAVRAWVQAVGAAGVAAQEVGEAAVAEAVEVVAAGRFRKNGGFA